ncbi:OVARIAN TUMOR DOMAIN-containing deubiquitinating enzyme 3 isoform X5 [Beta vulgaris subsp. vulgaris]|uniref:OVARIAN TUMOR DOMAIN-containing deubiquitinating enzyme 3 isoform X5 n=1 Tax=Beta vulgaris subsp. vulgaris TaxID=3555 RepID=UPI00203691BC|nr:OVARIAN TUMOR DOMAIN-containing deubiquitinating enzyme 3 isoform X5 [Beta vulgaris subsp. vulgaris]
MDATSSNDTILEQLRSGSAQFELVSSAVTSISTLKENAKSVHMLQSNTSCRFLARMGPPLGGASSSNIKVERYAIQKVTGDGRCMFRALVSSSVKGMARNKGVSLTPRQERDNADELRAAVKEVICENENERRQYQEAVTAITVDEPLHRYCQRIGRSDFWGGESELLVLQKIVDLIATLLWYCQGYAISQSLYIYQKLRFDIQSSESEVEQDKDVL